jgi:tRNA(Ile)-lysidine synthase
VTGNTPDLAGLIRQAFTPSPPARLGVGVSGGGDSVALLHLLADWQGKGGPELTVATVDHGLRPEAAAEAAAVAKGCAALGVPHVTLEWRGWDGSGNLSDRARRARYELLAGWAKGQGVGTVALGHTFEDQAETVLMRLARGSGVDGLSGMAERRVADGLLWVRPLLQARREDLRVWLRARGIAWADDPTNDDTAYDRVKVRQALRVLEPLGVTVEGLVETAARMRRARDVLDAAAVALAQEAVEIEAGDVVIQRDRFDGAPEETRLRLLAHALGWVSRSDYRPRFSALADVMDCIGKGRRATLQGCLVMPRLATIRVTRELAAVGKPVSVGVGLWDGRWQISGPQASGLTVQALSETGLAQCPDWRLAGLPRPTVLSSPSIWQDERLVAAPIAGNSHGWTVKLTCGKEDFISTLIVH